MAIYNAQTIHLSPKYVVHYDHMFYRLYHSRVVVRQFVSGKYHFVQWPVASVGGVWCAGIQCSRMTHNYREMPAHSTPMVDHAFTEQVYFLIDFYGGYRLLIRKLPYTIISCSMQAAAIIIQAIYTFPVLWLALHCPCPNQCAHVTLQTRRQCLFHCSQQLSLCRPYGLWPLTLPA